MYKMRGNFAVDVRKTTAWAAIDIYIGAFLLLSTNYNVMGIK